MQKLWAGRFSEGTTALLDEFNASLPFDRELYKEDIKGSIAHSRMLASKSIITEDDQKAIEKGLLQVEGEIERGEFEFVINDEDIHMAIEKRLTEIVGDAGKKLHTARSRNDQVAVDFRLYVLRKNDLLVKKILNLCKALLLRAKDGKSALLPGMTHLQHAQPVNFGYHLAAYICMFKRDVERLESSYERNNICPLGCAALAGTPYNTDRFMLARTLGFREPSINCLDTVSDRDFALEMLFNISTLMMHISRLAEEMILWSSYEFKFITIADKYATGSSIMPQKKSPDVPELLRGKTGRVYGNLIGLFTVMKGLPLAYNKDTQEDKEGVFDSIRTAEISLEILKETIETMTINKESMLKAAKIGHLSATDLADYLVQKCNIPFREAHHITGRAVAEADRLGVDLSEMSLEALKSIDSMIDEDVLPKLNLENSMNARNSYGGTSLEQTEHQLKILEKWIFSFADRC